MATRPNSARPRHDPEQTNLAPAGLAVFAEPEFEVEVTDRVVYAQGLTRSDWDEPGPGTVTDLTLDVYEPVRTDCASMPAVVMIHGGGFNGGSSEHAQLSAMAEEYASRGWVAFSINYRLSGDAGTLPPDYPVTGIPSDRLDQWRALYPACRDAKAAVRWIRANADRFRLSEDHISVVGGSAGSILAVALGISEESDCTGEITLDQDPTLASTNLSESAKVQTVINHWGGEAVALMLEAIHGESRFDSSDAPLMIVHGTLDPSFNQAESLRDTYETNGVAYEFYPLEGKPHGPWGASVGAKSLTELGFDFIVEQQGLQLR